MKPYRPLPYLLALILAAWAPLRGAEDAGARERLLLDTGWRFHLGNEWGIGQNLAKAGTGYGPASASYSDATWRRVDLPHDWAIEVPFDPAADASHGFRAVGPGFPQNSVAWYRRSFDLPKADAGKRIWLKFDGVYRDCTVFVNGWFVAHNESGYSGFRCDVTDVVNVGGPNVVAVKVDASQFEGWFYEGAGIYRHVWLLKTAPLAVAPDGVDVYSRFRDNVPSGAAEMHMGTTLLNSLAGPAEATVSWEILGPKGATIATATRSARAQALGETLLEATAQVPSPELWSPETPVLYKLVTTVSSAGHVVDRVETAFGIRTVGFDANRGFLLNGRPYFLKGTSNHQDSAGVGSALPDRLQYFRIAKLKEMGCNAYRTTHNPPTPELLEACDRLGMLVMDENRLLGSDAAHLDLLRRLVRRDRNHPSVAIWSIGNEEFEVEAKPSGQRVAAAMQQVVKELDPTRPVTCNADLGDVYEGVDAAVEVRGWSYHPGKGMDDYHREHPLQPNVGSEQGSTVSTRGIYANDPVRGYVSAYDDNAPEWAQTAETWLTFFEARPWLSGGFVWTGFDYRGEPTPYGWPCISSHFGILDTCGFPKDNFWYYQAWWTDRPVLHLLPHWNWPGKEGQIIDVRVLSNLESVELFLNGRSLGRQTMKRFSELKWRVAYSPGVLLARGYSGVKAVAETQVETTGAAAAVTLEADRSRISGNGTDVSVVTVSLKDAAGRLVPVAGNEVSFDLEGPGKILGVGNGDPSCHEPDTYVSEAEIHAAPIGGWRLKKMATPPPDGLPEYAANFDDAAWAPVDVDGATGALAANERAIYRAHFAVSAADLQQAAVELRFARILSGTHVYVNGRYVSGSVDGRAAAIFNVKSLLHEGDNSVAVAVASYSPDPSGLSGGVTLRTQGLPPPVHWKRSAFNGLAQVLVQAGREPGTLKLTARAEGLQPSALTIEALPAAPIPSAP